MHKHRTLKIVLVALLCVGVGGAIALNVIVQNRLTAQRAGIGAVSEPSEPEALDGEGKYGRFTAHVDYTSMAAAEDAQVSTDVAWDDDWFFQDSSVYNHELATTCSVLSAIANSESSYYQAGSGSPAYMENALAALGFEKVSTASYQYRSEIVDEVVSFLTNTTDVTAYTLATKHVTSSETGDTKVLIMVSIRGSYGSEWLSDANMGSAINDLPTADHKGFEEAANEIMLQISDRLMEIVEEEGTNDLNDVAILVTGHSRGAATANIVASRLNLSVDMVSALAEGELEGELHHSIVYAYTFACPTTTCVDSANPSSAGDGYSSPHSSSYDNIFNILNPSDMVPRLPLASWGYERYGIDLWLPEQGQDGFDAQYETMKEKFLANVGTESPYDPSDVATVDAFEEKIGTEVATQSDFASFGGVTAIVKAIAVDMDAMKVLYGHYPNTYIAWMQAISADDLRTER